MDPRPTDTWMLADPQTNSGPPFPFGHYNNPVRPSEVLSPGATARSASGHEPGKHSPFRVIRLDLINGEPSIANAQLGVTGYRVDSTADLGVDNAPSRRSSWETVLGAIPGPLPYDSADRCSGDHCIKPNQLSGVLVASFKPDQATGPIRDLNRLIAEAGRTI